MALTDEAPPATINPRTARESARVYDIIWLLLLLIGTFVLVNRSDGATDPDFWWHLRAGDWILGHHAVPWREPFGRYILGKQWFEYSWLFDCLVSLLYKLGGLLAIFALTRVMMAACVLGLFDIVSQYVSQGYALALSFVYLVTLFQLETPRSWLFSILLFTLELRLLLKAYEKNRPWLLACLIPLFAIWANLHVEFIYGLGLLGLFGVVSSLPERWRTNEKRLFAPGWWWIGLALSTASTLVNPYGWRVYQVIYSYASDKAGLWALQEMRPFTFEGVGEWAAIALLILAIGAMAWSRKLSVLSCALLVVGCWFGFQAARHIWFLSMTSAVVAARALRERGAANPLNWRQILTTVLITVCAYAVEIHWGATSTAELEEATKRAYPVDASMFIADHNLPEPLFNTYDWGGFLMWKLPAMLVSIDGRGNLYGNEGVARFIDTVNGTKNWRNDPKLQNARTVLLPPGVPLSSLLRLDPAFKVEYEDNVAVVFVRQ